MYCNSDISASIAESELRQKQSELNYLKAAFVEFVEIVSSSLFLLKRGGYGRDDLERGLAKARKVLEES